MGRRLRRFIVWTLVMLMSWFWFSTNQPRQVQAIADGLDSVLEGK